MVDLHFPGVEFLMERATFYKTASSILLLLAFVSPAAAQQGRGSPGTPTTKKPDTKTPPRVVTSGSEQIKTPQPRPHIPSNLFISGTVLREDGTPPPFGATIEMDCGASVTRQAEVGSDGYFSFQVADDKNYGHAMPDASAGYTRDVFHTGESYSGAADPYREFFPNAVTQQTLAAKMVGCDVRAQLPGYRSSILRVKEVLQPGQNDLGAIIVYPLERIRGTRVSATNLLAPKKARKLLKQAKKALKEKKFEEAEAPLKSAVTGYPNFGEAWFELGQLYKQQHRDEEAEAAYLKAIETDQLYVNPYIGLSWLLCIEQKWREAADYTRQALNLDPLTFPEAYFMNALANFNINSTDIAEKSAKQYQSIHSRGAWILPD